MTQAEGTELDLIPIDHTTLIQLLKDCEESILEVHLLKKCFPEAYSSLFDDEMKLFQYHFSLFHHLFQVQEKLDREANLFLYISPFKIRIKPRSKTVCHHYNAETDQFCNQPKSDDTTYCNYHLSEITELDNLSLKYFYLDSSNLAIMNPLTLKKMISGLWEFVENQDLITQSYEILGMDASTPKAEIKRRYYQLAKRYHPDTNPGNTAHFCKLNQAYQLLMKVTP